MAILFTTQNLRHAQFWSFAAVLFLLLFFLFRSQSEKGKTDEIRKYQSERRLKGINRAMA
jgi:hypothetical protein